MDASRHSCRDMQKDSTQSRNARMHTVKGLEGTNRAHNGVARNRVERQRKRYTSTTESRCSSCLLNRTTTPFKSAGTQHDGTVAPATQDHVSPCTHSPANKTQIARQKNAKVGFSGNCSTDTPLTEPACIYACTSKRTRTQRSSNACACDSTAL